MGSEDEQVKAVFAAAMEKPAGERAAWLARICRGNAALRARVQTLLDAHERAGGFMDGARPESAGADDTDAAPALPEEQPGSVIGHYKLLQKIGEGGFGSVYMAEQVEPVVRRVALKVIKLGMDTKQVVARFEAERQALAMMDHPNIAKVLDAGATASGRPYFVMELVKGVPITEYCDTANLPVPERLELFAQVCGALQHAHQKGVIHRDVKPGNVLVTLHDGVPVPKVIDFGIAKAVDRRLTEKTVFTEFRQVIGTPEYMSPEQAENSGLDIDTRSDVYSLGVLLYELLTASTPFDAATLREKGYGEMLRIIREDDPPAPSTRIATLGDRLAVVARLHGVAPELFSRRLRGDLDSIVMKCLEKDRTRRYETASGLAADIRRHLSDEPVSAGPPGAGYRLRKFVRRHRAQVAAASVVLAVLVLGVVGTTIGMMRALGEKRRADDEAGRATSSARAESIARAAAQENEQKAVAETKRAEAAKDEEAAARRRAETISEFVTTALRSSDPEIAGGSQGTTILAAMGNAVADIDSGRFADDPLVESELLVTIGAILRNNGRLLEAEPVLTRALAIARRLDSSNVAGAMNELALVKSGLGRKDEAKQLFVAALERDQSHFQGDHPALSRGMINLASTLPAEEAEPLIRKALAMDRRLHPGDSADVSADLTNLATKLMDLGRTAEADALFAESLEMNTRLFAGDHPFLAKSLDNLGKARFALGRRDEAIRLLTDALAMRRRLFQGPHPDFATGLGNLAQLHLEGGRLADAERLYAEAVEMRRQIFQGDNDDVANGLATLADVLLEMERPDAAEPHAAQSLAMRRRLHPGDDLSVVAGLTQLGVAQAAQGRAADAGPLLLEAKEMLRRLAPGDSPTAAIAYDNLGKGFQRAGRLGDAEALLAQSLEIRQRIYSGDHADLAKGLNNLAGAIAARGRSSEALAMQRRSFEMYGRLFGADDPQLASVTGAYAVMLRDAGRAAEAEPHALRAVEMQRRRVQGDDPKLATACFNLGTIREALGRWPECVQPYEEANAMIRRLLPATNPNVLHATTRLATTYYFVGAADKAIPLFEEALKGEVAVLGREHPDTLMTIGNLGANYATVGRHAEAVPLLEEARQYANRYPQLGFVHGQLLHAYVGLAASGAEGFAAKAEALNDEFVAECRATSPKRSPQLAQGLVIAGLNLVELKSWDAAESLLREGLAIREALQPGAWTTFNTRSLLGAALHGQGKHADAEPLLLSGYRGLEEREATLDANGRSRLLQALERLVQFYEATGNAAEAAAWRKELESRRAANGGGR